MLWKLLKNGKKEMLLLEKQEKQHLQHMMPQENVKIRLNKH